MWNIARTHDRLRTLQNEISLGRKKLPDALEPYDFMNRDFALNDDRQFVTGKQHSTVSFVLFPPYN